jgi:hypothetical protein
MVEQALLMPIPRDNGRQHEERVMARLKKAIVPDRTEAVLLAAYKDWDIDSDRDAFVYRFPILAWSIRYENDYEDDDAVTVTDPITLSGCGEESGNFLGKCIEMPEGFSGHRFITTVDGLVYETEQEWLDAARKEKNENR